MGDKGEEGDKGDKGDKGGMLVLESSLWHPTRASRSLSNAVILRRMAFRQMPKDLPLRESRVTDRSMRSK